MVIINGYLLEVPGAPEVTARWINQFTSILTSFNKTVSIFTSILTSFNKTVSILLYNNYGIAKKFMSMHIGAIFH